MHSDQLRAMASRASSASRAAASCIPPGCAGDGDGGHSGEAERRGVAKEACARLAVVGAGGEARDGRGGQQDQFVVGEQIVHARAELA